MTSMKQRHMEMIKQGVESLHNDLDLADVELKVNGKTFQCHKAILASVSPYFRAMFTGGMKESREKSVTLQDIDEAAFEKFLKFVYTGKTEGFNDDVSEILRIAVVYQVDVLRDHCEGMLIEQLRVENCLELYRISCMYSCMSLRERSWPTVLDGFSSVWKTEDFDSLMLDEIIAIFKDDHLVTMDEEQVCEAALKWINADYPARKQDAYKIFKYIRLPHVSPEYLVNNLCKTKCMTENVSCRRLLDEAQCFHLLPARRLDYSNPRITYRADDDLEEVLLVITENDDERGSFYEGSWCLWAFSYHQRKWFTLAPIPLSDSPGRYFAMCAHSYDIYITGGIENPKSLIKFESERNEWVPSTGQLKKGRCKHVMVSVGNYLYCVGGMNPKLPRATQVMGSIEEYSISGQRWRTVGELTHPVHSMAATITGEQIVVFGGTAKDDIGLTCVQCFHVRLKEVTVVSNLPFSASSLLAVAIGETKYITLTGQKENSVLRVNDDIGFEDAPFELPNDGQVLGVSHHNGYFLYLLENPSIGKRHLGSIRQVNVTTGKIEVLSMRGNACLKPVHVCQRTYVDKRFLYHTYFQ